MLDYIRKVADQIVSFFNSLSTARKAGLLLLGIGILSGVIGLFNWAGNKSYRTLMANLSTEDSTNVIRLLREKNIPFRVDNNGQSVEVPPQYIYDLRLELATLALPQSSVVGYEVFDNQALGTTSFVQRINQKRALEGELMRTISAMKGVNRARVHLVIPKKSAFSEDQKDPTASVTLDLQRGHRLTDKNIFGIANLVAASVEGLDSSKVVIVDTQGRTLSKNEMDPYVRVTASQMDFQTKYEKEIENRITDLLSPIVGEGRVVAKVNVDLDFSRVSEVSTTYDPDGAAVRSVQRDDQAMNGTRPTPGGITGAPANTPDEDPNRDPASNAIRTNTQKNKNITNYAVPSTVTRVNRPHGNVQRLSVAVVVDRKQVKEKGEDGKVLAKSEPWTEERLKEFEEIVAKAVGLNAKRGDTIQIKNMEFVRQDFAEAERIIKEQETRSYIMNMIVYAVIGLIVILFFMFVVRPFIKWVTENTTDSVDTFLPQTIEELEKMQANQNMQALEEAVPVLPEKIDPEKVEGEMIREKIITLVDSNPHKAALIIRDWVREEGTQAKNEKTEGKTA